MKDSLNKMKNKEFENLIYDIETGYFTWSKDKYGKMKGKTAGCVSKDGYIRIEYNNKNYLAHRLAWLFTYGTWAEESIDHINGIKSDNRIVNLREVTTTGNMQNQRCASVSNKSMLLGAHYHKSRNKYQASIRVDGKLQYLGLFETAVEAHERYLIEKRKVHKTCTI